GRHAGAADVWFDGNIIAGGNVGTGGRAAQTRIRGQAAVSDGTAHRDRRRRGRPPPGRPGRGGRNRGVRADGDAGLLAAIGRDGGEGAGRLAAHGRPGFLRRGRVFVRARSA